MKTKHNINELRTHLFETIAALRDPANPMDIYRAETIANVGQVIVNSAKIEVEFLKATNSKANTGFMALVEGDAEDAEASAE